MRAAPGPAAPHPAPPVTSTTPPITPARAVTVASLTAGHCSPGATGRQWPAHLASGPVTPARPGQRVRPIRRHRARCGRALAIR
jgi:hypothetical protein